MNNPRMITSTIETSFTYVTKCGMCWTLISLHLFNWIEWFESFFHCSLFLTAKIFLFKDKDLTDKLAFWIRLITLGLWGQTSSALFGPKPSSSSMSFCVVVTRSLLRNRLVNRFKQGQKVAMNTSYIIEISISLIM